MGPAHKTGVSNGLKYGLLAALVFFTVVLLALPPIARPDFVMMKVGDPTLSQGQSGNYNIIVISENGYTGNVVLSAQNVPSGVTTSFNPSSVFVSPTQNGSSVFGVQVSYSAAPGSYSIIIVGTGTGGQIVHSIIFPLTITAANFVVTFSVSGMGSDATGTVLTVDGTNYAYSQLPLSFNWQYGSLHSFSWSSPVSCGSGCQYVWQSTSGLSTSQSGTITVPLNGGSVTATYQKQYQVVVNSPQGTPTGGGWYVAGSTDTIGVQSPVSCGSGCQYVFTGWSGTIAAAANPYSFTVNSPVTETANWQQQYYLTMNAGTGGTVSPSSSWYNAGQTISISATPNTGYQFTGWTGSGTGSYTGAADPATITMNSPITESASFSNIPYTVTFAVSPSGGGTTTPSGSQTYTYGQVVSISASPASGYTFSGWSSSTSSITIANPSSSSTTITVYGSGTVTANFSPISYTITFSVSGMGSDATGTVLTVDGTNYAYSQLPLSFNWQYGSSHTFSWSSPVSCGTGCQYVWQSTSGLSTSESGTITVSGSGSVTAAYQKEYQVTITVSPSGAGSTSPSGTAWYNAGASVSISATASSGYTFSLWSSSTSSITIASPGAASTTMTVGGSGTVTATFSQVYTVTFSVSGMGSDASGTVLTVDGVNYAYSSLPKSFSWAYGSSHSFSWNSPVSCGTGCEYVWQSTSGLSTSESGSITVIGGGSVTATYQKEYQVTVTSSPSTAGSTSPSGTAWYNAGASVSISATASSGYTFSLWSSSTSSITIASPGAASTTMTVGGSGTVTATFSQVYTVSFTESGLPSGTTWSVQFDGLVYSSSTTTITISNVMAGSHSWSVPVVSCSVSGCLYNPSPSSGSISVPTTTSVSVNFATEYQLIITVSPSGTGSVSENPAPDPTLSSLGMYYVSGTAVSLTATPNPGYYFNSWSGSGAGSYTGMANPASITMFGPISETAAFNPPVSTVLSVNMRNGYQGWTSCNAQGSTTYAVTYGVLQTSGGQGVPGATITLTWTWTSGSTFTDTTTTCSGGSGAPAGYYYIIEPNQFTTVCNPNVNSPQQVSASFNGQTINGFYYSPSSASESCSSVSYTITFSVSGMSSDASGTVLTVDGVSYSYSSLPQTFTWVSESTHAFSWSSPVSCGTGCEYVWQSTSGLSTSESGSITVIGGGSVTATYQKEYQVTVTSSPSTAGSTSPSGTAWYNAGASVSISATAGPGYTFASWSSSTSAITIASTTSPSTTATINGAGTITASFTYQVVSCPGGYASQVYGPDSSGNWVEVCVSNTTAVVNGYVTVMGYGFSWSPFTFYVYDTSYSPATVICNNGNSGGIVASCSTTWTHTSQNTNVGIYAAFAGGGGNTQPVFVSWSNGNTLSLSTSPSSAGSISFTFPTNLCNVNALFGANYSPPPGQLSLTATGTSMSTSCLPFSGSLSETTTNGYAFSSWTGSGSASVSCSTCSSTSMSFGSASGSITASFAALHYTVTFSESGINSGMPANGWCVTFGGTSYCSTTSTISIPNIATGSYPWSIATQYAASNEIQYTPSVSSGTMNVPSQTSQSVSFTTAYWVTMQASPSNEGSVSPSSQYVTAGGTLSISATPNSGYLFAGWSSSTSSITFASASSSSTTATINGYGSITGSFTTAYYTVTFSVSGMGSDASGTVLTVDGTNYAYSSLPLSFSWPYGSSHSFSWSSPVPCGSACYYIWASTSGLSTSQSGTVTVPLNGGSVTATYNKRVFDFSISMSTSSYTTYPGNYVTDTINLALVAGTTQPVSISVSPPAGWVATLSSTSCSPTCSSTLTLSVPNTASAGTYTVTVTGTSSDGLTTHSTSFTVTVQGDLILSISPSSGSAPIGGSSSATISASSHDTTVQLSVSLSISGCPSGVTCTLSSTSGTTPFSSTLTVSPSTSATPGTYTITVSGSATYYGTPQSASVTYTVTVYQPTFTLSLSPSSATIYPGQAVSITVSLSTSNGFNSAVTVSASGLPGGGSYIVWTPSSASCVPNCNINAYLQTQTGTASGTYTITFTGQGGGASASAQFTLTINPNPGSLSFNPSSLSLTTGQTGYVTVTLTYSGPSPAPTYTFSASSVPSGFTVSFSPTSCTPSTTSCSVTMKVYYNGNYAGSQQFLVVATPSSGVSTSAWYTVGTTVPTCITPSATWSPANVTQGGFFGASFSVSTCSSGDAVAVSAQATNSQGVVQSWTFYYCTQESTSCSNSYSAVAPYSLDLVAIVPSSGTPPGAYTVSLKFLDQYNNVAYISMNVNVVDRVVVQEQFSSLGTFGDYRCSSASGVYILCLTVSNANPATGQAANVYAFVSRTDGGHGSITISSSNAQISQSCNSTTFTVVCSASPSSPQMASFTATYKYWTGSTWVTPVQVTTPINVIWGSLGVSTSLAPGYHDYASTPSLSVCAGTSTVWPFNIWNFIATSPSASVTTLCTPQFSPTESGVAFASASYNTGTATLTIPAQTGGTTSPSGTTSYTTGTQVNVCATPAVGYIFTGWTGNNVPFSSTTAAQCTTVTLWNNIVETPSFTAQYYYVYDNWNDGTADGWVAGTVSCSSYCTSNALNAVSDPSNPNYDYVQSQTMSLGSLGYSSGPLYMSFSISPTWDNTCDVSETVVVNVYDTTSNSLVFTQTISGLAFSHYSFTFSFSITPTDSFYVQILGQDQDQSNSNCPTPPGPTMPGLFSIDNFGISVPYNGNPPQVYTPSFTESGLPSGTSWSVQFGDCFMGPCSLNTYSSTSATITTTPVLIVSNQYSFSYYPWDISPTQMYVGGTNYQVTSATSGYISSSSQVSQSVTWTAVHFVPYGPYTEYSWCASSKYCSVAQYYYSTLLTTYYSGYYWTISKICSNYYTCYVYYFSSANGQTWNGPTQLISLYPSYSYDPDPVAVFDPSSGVVHLIFEESESSSYPGNLQFMQIDVSLSSSGMATASLVCSLSGGWGNPLACDTSLSTNVAPIGAGSISVTLDTSGNLWFGAGYTVNQYCYYSGSSGYPCYGIALFEKAVGSSSWKYITSLLSTKQQIGFSLVPLASGNLGLVYGTASSVAPGGGYSYTTGFTFATVSPSGSILNQASTSATNYFITSRSVIGSPSTNSIYVGAVDSSYGIWFLSWQSGSSSVSTFQLDINLDFVSLSADGTGKIVAVESGSAMGGMTDYYRGLILYRYSTNYGATWSTQVTISSSEFGGCQSCSNAGIQQPPVPSVIMVNGITTINWVAGYYSGTWWYQLRFAYIQY